MSLLQLFTATDAAPYAWSLVLSGGYVVASILPLGAARSAANFEMKDMAAPRAMFDRYPAWGKRASWAHQNSFEAFSLHAPAALLALTAAQHTGTLPIAVVSAFAHPALRAHRRLRGAFPARGLCWATGLLCSGILYSEGLRALLSS